MLISGTGYVQNTNKCYLVGLDTDTYKTSSIVIEWDWICAYHQQVLFSGFGYRYAQNIIKCYSVGLDMYNALSNATADLVSTKASFNYFFPRAA